MIAYYVHHQGSGHVHRAAAIAAAARSPLVGLSTRPAPAGWAGEWIVLPSDVEGGAAEDVTAGGTLHWAPRRHPGLRDRMTAIGAVVARARLVVVDVSVEVALLARLHGVPVVVMAQPGDRTDRPHRLAYDLAERLLAPWPARPAAGWPPEWAAKTVHLGALSRFDGRPAPRVDTGRRVLVLWGAGGLDVGPAQLRAAAAAAPGWSWDVVGPPPPGGRGTTPPPGGRGTTPPPGGTGTTPPPGGTGTAPPSGGADPANLRWRGWVDDVWTELGAADVVITHAGQNALAEVAAARRPAVVVPQQRPHGEQDATAAALARAGIALPVDRWPGPDAWPGLLDAAAARGGADWARWSDGGAAARAAAVLDGLAA